MQKGAFGVESKFFDTSRGAALCLACYEKVIVNVVGSSARRLYIYIDRSVEPGSLETAGFACGTAHRRVMRHLFDFFSGYVLRPRGVAIRD